MSGTNGLAIASLVVVFFSSVIGLIMGYVALNQIRQTGQDGHGLALAAVIIGWIATVLGLVIILLVVVGMFLMIPHR
ncbi:DUF4190 domain-containing protein [Psychromicrobium xiongbiense]|uniref:DUF4190 domain-containing protein n=1 Tax=Psychromicrobium xiongbiense TaxID=3051184 RepID=UPI0025577029|nr:DUF4190 domain-containing protein [Psychromicrobium sp. YIM S02556]